MARLFWWKYEHQQLGIEASLEPYSRPHNLFFSWCQKAWLGIHDVDHGRACTGTGLYLTENIWCSGSINISQLWARSWAQVTACDYVLPKSQLVHPSVQPYVCQWETIFTLVSVACQGDLKSAAKAKCFAAHKTNGDETLQMDDVIIAESPQHRYMTANIMLVQVPIRTKKELFSLMP